MMWLFYLSPRIMYYSLVDNDDEMLHRFVEVHSKIFYS